MGKTYRQSPLVLWAAFSHFVLATIGSKANAGIFGKTVLTALFRDWSGLGFANLQSLSTCTFVVVHSSRENLSEVTLPDFGPGWVGLGFGFSLGLVLLGTSSYFAVPVSLTLFVRVTCTPQGWGGGVGEVRIP